MFLYKSAKLALALLCGLTVAVSASAAKTEPKRDEAATPKAKAVATPAPAQVTYTNADLEKLPTPENDSLPSLEPPPDVTPLPPVPPSEAAQPDAPAAAAPAPSAAPTPDAAPTPGGTPAPVTPAPPSKADAPGGAAPKEAARVDPRTIKWLEGQLESLELEQAIAAARRRVDEATAKLGVLQGSLRPDGSAFPADTVAAEKMYVRDVADQDNRRDAALQSAYDEQAAARAELQGLLSESAAPRR